jgi:DNA-binding NarL/FixJ family response regulator
METEELSPNCRILIVDDHQVLIDGIKSLLRKEKQIEFTSQANSAESALRYLEEHSGEIDLVLTDISMPGMSGLELTRIIKEKYPHIKILVLSMYNEPSVVEDILATDAEGYILKNVGKEELAEAIQKIHDGGSYYSSEVIASLLKKNKEGSKKQKRNINEMLTNREIEIVKLICEEMTTAEIAEKLFISPRTVDTHRKHILEKTSSRSVVSLIKLAYESSLIPHPDL